MTSFLPSMAEMDEVFDRPGAPFRGATLDTVARKLADRCCPTQLHDDAHVIAVLVEAGVTPEHIDLTRWSELKERARHFAQIEYHLARENFHAAIACIVVVALAGLALAAPAPALAGTDSPSASPTMWEIAAAMLIGIVAVAGIFSGGRRRPRVTADPHTEPYGEASAYRREREG